MPKFDDGNKIMYYSPEAERFLREAQERTYKKREQDRIDLNDFLIQTDEKVDAKYDWVFAAICISCLLSILTVASYLDAAAAL
jgi:hypothetical protein